MKRNDRVNIILLVIIAGLSAAILFVAGRLGFYVAGYLSDRKSYEEIKESVIQEQAVAGSSSTVDWEALRKINPDAAGWLTACNGEIDGPVVQAFDDSFYLTHLFDKSEGDAGAFFADTLSYPAFKNSCTVIYGHNRKDGSMFHPLLNYRDEEYYKSCPYFTVYTEDGENRYNIIAAFYADLSDIPGIGDGETDTGRIIDKALEMSLYQTDHFSGTENVNLVILCTCEYSGSNNRMVVYAIKTPISA